MSETHRIETFVGRKYGLWARGLTTYASEAHAIAAIATHTLAEKACNATIMTRRAVPA